MSRVSVQSILGKVLQVTSKRAKTLRAHGVTLVSLYSWLACAYFEKHFKSHHGTAANLVLLKRLLNLLKHSQVADINSNTLASRAERAKSVTNIHVDLTGVGLTRNNESRAEASLLSDKLIQLLNLRVVTLEDLEERGLGTSGTLDTTEAQVITRALKVTQIHKQILDPQASTLANSNQLSRLAVGESQTRKVLVLLGELRQLVDDNGQLGDEDVETVAEQDQIGVISTVAGGSTPVDDTGGGRGDEAEGVDVGHDIVSAALLFLGGDLEFGVLNDGVGLHLLNGFVGDGKSELYVQNHPVN